MKEKLSERLRASFDYRHGDSHMNLSMAVASAVNAPIAKAAMDALIAEIADLEEKAACNDYTNWCAAIRGDEEAPEHMRQIVEKYCLRLPVDKDGVPWKIGDMCSFGDFYGEDRLVKKIYGLHYINFGEWVLQPENDLFWFRVDGCSRPAAPVRDADGVEIKVGDVVYSLLNDGEEPYGTCYRVQAIDHSRPFPVECANNANDLLFGFMFNGESLTHKEPDSWDALIADMSVDYCESDTISVDVVSEWVNRIVSLRERDA